MTLVEDRRANSRRVAGWSSLCALVILSVVSPSQLRAGFDLTVEPSALDFAEVHIGSSKLDSLLLANNDGVDTLRISFSLARGTPFTIVNPPSVTLPPRRFVRLSIRFEPISAECARDTLLIYVDQVETTLRVPLFGCVPRPDSLQVPGLFILEQGEGFVGESIETPLSINSELGSNKEVFDPPDSIRFEVRYDPDQLWPVRLMEEAGVKLQGVIYDRETGIVAGEMLVGEPWDEQSGGIIPLLAIEWIGLSTGRPENRFEIELTGTTRRPARIDTLLGGRVLLDGCTVASEPFAQRFSLQALRFDPKNGMIQAEILLSDGEVLPSATIHDLSGRSASMSSRQAERVDGDTTLFQIPVDHLSAGIYLLSLRREDDQVTIPFYLP